MKTDLTSSEGRTAEYLRRLELQFQIIFNQVKSLSYALKNSKLFSYKREVAIQRFHPSIVTLHGGVLIEAGSLDTTEEVDQMTYKFNREQVIFNEIEKRQSADLRESIKKAVNPNYIPPPPKDVKPV